MTPFAALRLPRRIALVLIAVLVTAATSTALAESFRALVTWAAHHGLHGAWAIIWPLQVDVFVVVGELSLFVALADQWPGRSRAGAWVVVVTGLAVSVAANVGHVASHAFTVRATAAVPPLAAASALAVGLGVLKRVVGTQAADDVRAVDPHAEALAAARSDASKIRYAANTTGSADAEVISQWLAERGHPVAPANIRTALRRQVTKESGQSAVVSLRATGT